MAGISENYLKFAPIMNADTAHQYPIAYMWCVIVAAVLAVQVVLGSFSFPRPRRTHLAAPQGAGQLQALREHHQTADA